MDRIQFHNVLPHPLKDSPVDGDIWQRDLQLERGKNYLIMADSGRGKSTFLNIIYGIRKDYSGKVTLDNEDVSHMHSDHFSFLRQKYLSYLFQDLRLFLNMTARENILLKPGCKFTSAEIEFYADKLGVTKFLDRKCASLSLGQQQRIAILRALSQPFQWLLLDEPFSHLDEANTAKMLELVLQRAAEEHAGIIATSLGSTKGFEQFNILNL